MALDKKGFLYGWGQNEDGEISPDLGDMGLRIFDPILIKGISNIVEIKSGRRFNLALNAKGEVYCWGWKVYGSSVVDTIGRTLGPQQVILPERIVSIAAGGYHSLALGESGKVYGWGWNFYFQLGNQSAQRGKLSKNVVFYPSELKGMKNITAIAAGESFSLFLDNQGRVFSIGRTGLKSLYNIESSDKKPSILRCPSKKSDNKWLSVVFNGNSIVPDITKLELLIKGFFGQKISL